MTVPRSTRAAVLVTHGADLELQELPLPAEIEPGAALVEIDCATLCGTDIEIWNGTFGFPDMLPLVLGHEMTGRILAAGPGATDALGRELKPGMRIGWSESTCGHCYGCAVLREPVACAQRGYGFLQRSDAPPFATAGLADHAYVTPGAAKLLLPDEVPPALAAMAGCAAKTVLRAVTRAGGIRPASRVVVQGAGALGIFATAVAAICGARQVITVGAPAARLGLAARFGATATVDIAAGSEGIVERVMELTEGHGADHVFDFAGAPSVGREAIGMAAQRGTFTVVGSTGGRLSELPLAAIMAKELTVVGSVNGDIGDYFQAIEYFRAFAGRMPWHELLSAPVGLAGVTASVRSMAALAEVKAVIDPHLG